MPARARESRLLARSAVEYGPTAVLAASFFLIFLAAEAVAFGFWGNAEPLVVGFHAVSACGSAILIVLAIRAPREFAATIRHPIVLAPALLALWSAVSAPYAAFPWTSILGSPQSGQGAVWFANFAVLAACARCVAARERQWRIVVAAATAAVFLAVAAKGLAIASGGGSLIFVNDYVAYFGIALPFLSFRHRYRPLLVAAAAASVLALLVSGNKAALVLSAIGLVGLVAVRIVDRFDVAIRVRRSRPIAAAIVLAAAALPYLLVRTGSWAEATPSLYARQLVWVVMDAAQEGGTWPWIVGHGWGHTQEGLLAFLTTAQQNLWNPTWDFLWRDYFHSHNWFVEALYSAGIPGVALTLVLFLAIPLTAEGEWRAEATIFAAVLAGLEGLWFQLSFSVPFVAAAAASFGSTAPIAVPRREGETANALRNGALPLLVLLAAAQSTSAVQLLSFGVRVSSAITAYESPQVDPRRIAFPADLRGSESAFSHVVREHLARLAQGRGDLSGSEAERQRSVLQVMVDDLQLRIARTDSVLLAATGVWVFSEAFFNPLWAWSKSALVGKEDLWGLWLDRLLELAPGRTDGAVTYFSWLLAADHRDVLEAKTRRILDRNASDPVAHYFLGALLAASPLEDAKRTGIGHLRAALGFGIERYLPVTPELKAAILQAR